MNKNSIIINSNLKIKIIGNNNIKVYVGSNVRIPFEIVVGNDSELYIGDNVEIKSGCIGKIEKSTLRIGNNVKFGVNTNIWAVLESKIEIGSDSTFGSNSIVRAHAYCNVEIGEDCMFSWDTRLIAGDGHAIFDISSKRMINDPRENDLSIVVGNHVWAGGESVFLSPAKIASGSVLGYRSLVKGNFPNNCVIAGHPAKVIRENVCWDRKYTSANSMDTNYIFI